jgi:acetyl-CoA carboxylase biotin carboxyl carrier protein
MAKKAKADAEQDTSGDVVAMARGLAEIVSEHHLTELVIESNGTTITVRREAAVTMAAPAPMAMPVAQAYAPPPAYAAPAAHAAAPAPAAAAPAADDKSHVVTSPFVGTFYRKPNPDSPAYVALNDRIEKGAVLCIVEAMKLMNEIEADVSGTVVGILVEDGASVEYGQPLFKIAP